MDDTLDQTLEFMFAFNFCPKVKPALGSTHHVSNLPLSLSLSLSLSLAQMVKLQACIKYCEEDYSAAKVTGSLTLTDNAYRLHLFCPIWCKLLSCTAKNTHEF